MFLVNCMQQSNFWCILPWQKPLHILSLIPIAALVFFSLNNRSLIFNGMFAFNAMKTIGYIGIEWYYRGNRQNTTRPTKKKQLDNFRLFVWGFPIFFGRTQSPHIIVDNHTFFFKTLLFVPKLPRVCDSNQFLG